MIKDKKAQDAATQGASIIVSIVFLVIFLLLFVLMYPVMEPFLGQIIEADISALDVLLYGLIPFFLVIIGIYRILT